MSDRQEANLSNRPFESILTGKHENILKREGNLLLLENVDFINYSKYIILLRNIRNTDPSIEKIEFSNCRFLGSQKELSNIRLLSEGIEINVTFSDGTEFSTLESHHTNLQILNCTGDQIIISNSPTLHLEKNDFRNYFIKRSHFNQSPTWSGKNIQMLEILNSTFDHNFTIQKNCEIQDLVLNDFKSKAGNITVRGKIGSSKLSHVKSNTLLFKGHKTEKLSLFNCTISDFTLESVNDFQISECTLTTGVVRNSAGESAHFENNNTNDFTFESTNYNVLEIYNQNISNLRLIENNGTLELKHTHCDNFPNILKNNYLKVSVFSLRCRQFTQNDLQTNIEKIIFSDTSIEIFELKTSGLKRLTIEKGKEIGNAEISLNQSEEIVISDSPFDKLSITGSIGSLKIGCHPALGPKGINQLTLSDLTDSEVFINRQAIDLLYFDAFEAKNLGVFDVTYKKIEFTGTQSKPKILFGKASNDQQYDWKIEIIEGASITFISNSFDSLNIEKVPEVSFGNCLLENNNEIAELTIDNTAIKKWESLESSIGKLVFHSKEKGHLGDFLFQDGSVQLARFLNSYISKIDIINVHIAQIDITNSGFRIFHMYTCTGVEEAHGIENFKVKNSDILELDLNNSHFQTLEINHFKPKNFNLKDLLIETIRFEDFERLDNEKGVYKMSSINAGNFKAKSFFIHDSNLGNLELNSCYFENFEEINVKSSKLDYINCTATTWPKKVNSLDESGKSDPFQVREACRQLKLAMAGHQDRVSELQFHALEMNAYRKIVLKGWRRPKNWNDILSLLAGWTNQFGLNWALPSGLLIAFNVILYWITVKLHFDESWTGPLFRCGNLHDFLMLFNPVHKTTEIYHGSISGAVAIWDFVGRIVTAFFLYQIVTAFRKYRK